MYILRQNGQLQVAVSWMKHFHYSCRATVSIEQAVTKMHSLLENHFIASYESLEMVGT